jgi:hypothetical protein
MKQGHIPSLAIATCLFLGAVATSAAIPALAQSTWQSVTIPDLPSGTYLGPLWTPQPNLLYVWGEQLSTDGAAIPNSTLYKTTDGGTTWTGVFSLPSFASYDVWGTGPSDIFVAAFKCATGYTAGCGADQGSSIWRSTDGGATWVPQTLPGNVSGPINNLGGSPGNVQAIAWGLGIIRFDGTSWSTVFARSDGRFNDQPWRLAMLSDTEGYYTTCWGWGPWNGLSWSFHGVQFDFCDVYDLWGIRDSAGQLHLYTIGNNNFSNGIKVWKFNEATQSFGSKYGYVLSDGNTRNCGSGHAIWGSSENDVWAVGRFHESGPCNSNPAGEARIWRFDGNSWSRVTTPFDPLPAGRWIGRTVWGTGPNDVWIAYRDRLLHFGLVNHPPVANAGVDQTVECAGPTGTLVTLNGSASSDPDNDPLTYAWTGPFGTASGVSPTVTLPYGTSTITLVVNDGTVDSSPDTVDITIHDTTAPTLTLSSNSVTVVLPTASAPGASVNVLTASGASATDVCCDSSVTLSPAGTSNYAVGTTTAYITASDCHSNTSAGQPFTVNVVYNFSGFLPPIRVDGSGIFRSGRTIPVKFQLTAADGSIVSNATATLLVAQVSGGVIGSFEEITPEAAGNSNLDNLFRFDPTSGQYIYNLQAKGFPTGTYVLRAHLNDGTDHDVYVSIR